MSFMAYAHIIGFPGTPRGLEQDKSTLEYQSPHQRDLSSVLTSNPIKCKYLCDSCKWTEKNKHVYQPTRKLSSLPVALGCPHYLGHNFFPTETSQPINTVHIFWSLCPWERDLVWFLYPIPQGFSSLLFHPKNNSSGSFGGHTLGKPMISALEVTTLSAPRKKKHKW